MKQLELIVANTTPQERHEYKIARRTRELTRLVHRLRLRVTRSNASLALMVRTLERLNLKPEMDPITRALK